MNWLMLCLAAIGGPEHPVFLKGYKPEPEPEGIPPLYKQPLIWNEDGFFDGGTQVSTLEFLLFCPA